MKVLLAGMIKEAGKRAKEMKLIEEQYAIMVKTR